MKISIESILNFIKFYIKELHYCKAIKEENEKREKKSGYFKRT